MRIGVYLTCQGKFLSALKDYLPPGTEVFYEENWVMFAEGRTPTAEWQHLDYFIYQPIIEPQKPEYADEHILANHVCSTATKIRVPYVMFTGLTPWRQYCDTNLLGTEHRHSWLDAAIADGQDVGLAIQDVMMRSDENAKLNAEHSLAQLREKEAGSDVMGLADWISDRYLHEHLFWTPNHPRGSLALEFCNLVLAKMGLPRAPRSAAYELDSVLNVERTPLLPGVSASLGIQYRDNVAFFKHDHVRSVESYLTEYARRLQSLTEAETAT